MDQAFEPAYLELLRSGELKKRAEAAYKRLEACDICPRECGVNRRESATIAVRGTGGSGQGGTSATESMEGWFPWDYLPIVRTYPVCYNQVMEYAIQGKKRAARKAGHH